MGCDIHLILEQKFGDKWIGVREVEHFPVVKFDASTKEWERGYIWLRASNRNYDLFGKLANVRHEGPAPKGLPDDASELSRVFSDKMGGDAHSHSHCTLQEYIEALAATESMPAEVFLTSSHPAVETPHQYYFGMYEPEEGEQYRVVFWFDNW